MTKISEVNTSEMDESSRQDYIKNFSKRMLKTCLFMGSYQEKRFVESLNSYRDVVKIDSDEKEFIENLIAVKKKLKQVSVDNQSRSPTWIGITDPQTIGAPVGYHLWVVLPIEVFGNYWFKVKTVEFLADEVRVKLDIVRPLKHEKSVSDVSESETQDFQNIDIKATVQEATNKLWENLLVTFKEYVTLANIKESVIFISLLTGTLIAGGANIIKYLMEYFLKFMRELSGLIKVCSPIIITCLNIIGKTIYGFYALIVALWSGRSVPHPPTYNAHYPNSALDFKDPRTRYNKYLTYKPSSHRGSTVTITPLDD